MSRFSNAILEQSIRVDRRYRSGIIAHRVTFLRDVSDRNIIASANRGILLSATSNCAFSVASRVASVIVIVHPSVRLSVRSFVRSAQFGTVCAASKLRLRSHVGGKKRRLISRAISRGDSDTSSGRTEEARRDDACYYPGPVV